MNRDYDVELLIKLGKQVDNKLATWSEMSSVWFKNTGENLTHSALSKRYHRAKVVLQNENPEENNFEYERVDDKGNVDAQKIVTLPPNVKKTPELLLDALGYDHNFYNLKWHQCSMWDQKSKVADKCLYAVKFRVEPRIEPVFSPEEFADELEALLSRKIAPIQLEEKKAFDKLNKKKLMECPAIELHLGKMAWHGDTGEDYDHNIAEKRFHEITQEIVDKQKDQQCSKLVMCIGNDFFNSDTIDTTTTKGTPQQNDMRWKKMFLKGLKMYSQQLVTLRPYFDKIDVKLVQGNHAKMAEFYLFVALAQALKGDNVIKFDNDYKETKGIKWGVCGIFWNHGDQNAKRLNKSIAVEFPQIWGKTIFRELHCGHLHTEKVVDEEGGLITRRISSPSGTDDWHYGQRYMSLQKHPLFIWDKEKGMTAMYNVNFLQKNPKMLKKEK